SSASVWSHTESTACDCATRLSHRTMVSSFRDPTPTKALVLAASSVRLGGIQLAHPVGTRIRARDPGSSAGGTGGHSRRRRGGGPREGQPSASRTAPARRDRLLLPRAEPLGAA